MWSLIHLYCCHDSSAPSANGDDKNLSQKHQQSSSGCGDLLWKQLQFQVQYNFFKSSENSTNSMWWSNHEKKHCNLYNSVPWCYLNPKEAQPFQYNCQICQYFMISTEHNTVPPLTKLTGQYRKVVKLNKRLWLLMMLKCEASESLSKGIVLERQWLLPCSFH